MEPLTMTDGQLLAEYAATRSPEAFAAIVERHAGMVSAACGRLLGDAHAAEDAVQAVFMILVRKAARLRPDTNLAGWLYLTAQAVARNVRKEEARRRRREREVAMRDAAEVCGAESGLWPEVRAHLDAALTQLPAVQREAVVMRYLQGRSEAEVCQELGCPQSTLSSRITRGLERLRSLLAGRGVTVPAAALGGMLAAEAGPAALPAALVAALRGIGAGAPAASATATSLAEGTMKAMTIAKLKLVAAVVAGVMIVGGGGSAVAVRLAAAAGEPAKATATAVKVEDIKTASAPPRWDEEREKGQPPSEGNKQAIWPRPLERGKHYPAPAQKWLYSAPQLWGWSCELPDGSGLAFGGLDQQGEDGAFHTRIREGGQWKPILDELRKNNPLQKHHAAAWALRNACKDTLARARHLYYEGKTAEEEARLLAADVDPAIAKLAADIAKLAGELKAAGGLGDYEAGQAKFAARRLEAAAGMLKPFGGRTTPEQLLAMRKAQIELELAAEPLDAEPAPRALSFIAYEPKTGLYAVFGGTHFDYVTNDLWVFDPARRRWFQRHPAGSPEPRADHRFEPLGDGRIALRGGFRNGNEEDPRSRLYVHAGPARWIYDAAADAWSADAHAEKLAASDSRSYYPDYPRYEPEWYMKGARPDAAAQEAKLKAIPANTWVPLDPPVRVVGGRDWATLAYDAARDMLYYWGGGHCVYSGSDVIRYHLATNRWEQTEPSEQPLGGTSSNEQYPMGVNLNRRPWMKGHPWNCYAHDPLSGRMIMGGSQDLKVDPHTYSYDPDRGDWSGTRVRVPKGMESIVINVQLRATRQGMLAWTPDEGRLWLLDAKGTEWKKFPFKGAVPGPGVDSCGLVYDSKRDRMLFVNAAGYDGQCSMQIVALDFKTMEAAPLNPEGMDAPAESRKFFCREVAYEPEADLFVWAEGLESDKAVHPAYDPKANRWVALRPGGVASVNLHGGLVYDGKRKLLVMSALASRNGQVWALRLDPATAEIKPLKNFVAPAGTGGEKK